MKYLVSSESFRHSFILIIQLLSEFENQSYLGLNYRNEFPDYDFLSNFYEWKCLVCPLTWL